MTLGVGDVVAKVTKKGDSWVLVEGEQVISTNSRWLQTGDTIVHADLLVKE